MNTLKSIDFADAALSIFSSGKSGAGRYLGEVQWLKERKLIWSGNKIRIGVLGVTSSGKSTLINSVMGVELLSTAVKPTSSQLVSCHKGEPKAIVSFRDEKPDIVLEGSALNLSNIKKYSDENENRKNIENVSGITISTLDFDFGYDAILIDSAGLDAYQLESHERLSLEVLLPTIDICIFVTTLKASSDQKTKSVLNAVAKHNCPLLIVQNMLDSVEQSADGKKSKEEVAFEHKMRIKRIVDNSEIRDKSSVHIVQISAINAVQSRCYHKKEKQSSRYFEFKSITEDMINTARPMIDSERLRTLAARYNEFIKTEEKALSGRPSEIPEFRFEGLKNRLRADVAAIDKEIKTAVSELASLVPGGEAEASKRRTGFVPFFSLSPEPHSRDSAEIEFDIDIATAQANVKKCENAILEAITKTNKIIKDISERLGIPLRDFNPQIRLEALKSPEEITKIDYRSRKVKKETIGGFFARGAGWLFRNDDWGYEYVTDAVTVIDEARTAKEIKKYIKRAAEAHSRTTYNWRNGLNVVLDSIYSAIDNEYVIFLERQKEIEDAAEVSRIVGQLKELLQKIPLPTKQAAANKGIAETKNTHSNAILSDIAVSKYQLGLHSVSKQILRTISKKTLETLLEAANGPPHSVILGWDSFSIQNFAIRYMGLSFDEKHYDALTKSGKTTVNGVLCLYAPPQTLLSDMKNVSPPTTFFIMVNAQQDGSAKNQISRLALADNLKQSDKVFFVVQDFISLINSGGISEMKQNLKEYYDDFGIADKKAPILINSDNPLYNLAFVQNQLEPCGSIAEEQEFLTLLKGKFGILWSPSVSEVIAELLRRPINEAE